ncbi:MAG: hypothetical protein COA93_00455 [Alphaproteobacteria bacterium]|nr:MAG: hypothetical protein COA93_00455 [Alphaproteobacteria bacterium]
MQETIVALGVASVLEGILYTLFPEAVRHTFFPALMRKMMGQVINLPEAQIRYSGLAAAFLGFCIIYAMK